MTFIRASLKYNSVNLMKTAILQVEPFDNTASIRDRILWCKSERILLVLPKQKRTFPNRVDLNLFARWAEENGASFALVSRNDITREYAQSLGISVFGSIPEAQKGDWKSSAFRKKAAAGFRGKEAVYRLQENGNNKKETTTLHPGIRWFLISLSSLALLTMAFFIIPSATVIVYPEMKTQEMTLDLRASTEIGQANITGLLPAVEETVTVTGQMTIPSTGSVLIGIQKADGEVTVRNLTTQAVTLPKGAVFATGGEPYLRFAALTETNIPVGTEDIKIPVEALSTGPEGNVEPGQITLLEGSDGLKVEVINQQSFTGGSAAEANSPTESDYKRARDLLLEELDKKALDTIDKDKSTSASPIQNSLKLKEVVVEERENPVDEPSDTLTLDMTAVYSVLIYDKELLASMVKEVMDISIPEGYHDAENTATLLQQGDAFINPDREASWRVVASREIVKDLPGSQLLIRLKGKEKTAAIKWLNEEILHRKPAEIHTFVKWWPWMPMLVNRINLVENSSDNG